MAKTGPLLAEFWGHFNPAVTIALLTTGRIPAPARSFRPALVKGFWQWHWAYWVAPIGARW
jgi:glycerol uptake facilitator-like aquaporin